MKVPEIKSSGSELDVGAVEPGRPLGPRQVEILALVGQGYSDKEIARTLGISRHTVRTHLERLFYTHGWNNRAQAATAWSRSSIQFSIER